MTCRGRFIEAREPMKRRDIVSLHLTNRENGIGTQLEFVTWSATTRQMRERRSSWNGHRRTAGGTAIATKGESAIPAVVLGTQLEPAHGFGTTVAISALHFPLVRLELDHRLGQVLESVQCEQTTVQLWCILASRFESLSEFVSLLAVVGNRAHLGSGNERQFALKRARVPFLKRVHVSSYKKKQKRERCIFFCVRTSFFSASELSPSSSVNGTRRNKDRSSSAYLSP